MNTWDNRLRLTRLLAAPPPPEAHAGSPAAWKGGWAARLAGEGELRQRGPRRHVAAWQAGYAACAVAIDSSKENQQ